MPELGLRALLKAIGIDLSNTEFWYAFSGLVLVARRLAGAQPLPQPDRPRACGRCTVPRSRPAPSASMSRITSSSAFVISAVYASVSGSLLALQNKFITPDVAGFMHSIEMVTMAVLGGAGSVLGAILGAAILTTLPQVLTIFQEYEQLMLGLVMMLVMIFMREGLLPSIARRIRGRARMSLLQIEGLGIDFGGLRAVNDVGFSLKPGEIVSVIGPNGAGKTTLFNMISGVYAPARGRVVLDGEDVTGMPPHLLARRGLSRTFQNLQIFQSMTVLENAIAGHHLHERGSVFADLFSLPAVAPPQPSVARKAPGHCSTASASAAPPNRRRARSPTAR